MLTSDTGVWLASRDVKCGEYPINKHSKRLVQASSVRQRQHGGGNKEGEVMEGEEAPRTVWIGKWIWTDRELDGKENLACWIPRAHVWKLVEMGRGGQC